MKIFLHNQRQKSKEINHRIGECIASHITNIN